MSTTLLFVRHGQTQWNKERRFSGSKNSPLTAEGRRQAAELAKKLANHTIDNSLY
jgi:probable phosphoglycerate mutase